MSSGGGDPSVRAVLGCGAFVLCQLTGTISKNSLRFMVPVFEIERYQMREADSGFCFLPFSIHRPFLLPVPASVGSAPDAEVTDAYKPYAVR